jgi:hypothetical protein
MNSDSKPLTHEAFVEHCNSRFRILGVTAEPIELELIEVSELRRSRIQESFSLTFRGPAPFVMEQRIYAMEHSVLGLAELFLVPVSRDSEGVCYEAVFNHILPSN